MKVADLEFKSEQVAEENTLFSVNVDGLRITVLDRMTGFGGGIRDIETGFRDKSDKFWLASGNFDIRDFPEMTLEEAVEHIKKNANTCVGV